MELSTLIFYGFRILFLGIPTILAKISKLLAPCTHYLSKTAIIGPLFSFIIRSFFFMGFIILLMSDQLVRTFFRIIIGRHPSKRNYSITSAMDPRIEMFDYSIPKTKHLENKELFNKRKQQQHNIFGGDPESRALTELLKRPKYSVSLAYTLSVASKLVYEDVEIIKYELAKAGFDVENTFRPIAYKNICAFIAEKDDDILLVFRGTNPLNIQNYLTNISMTKTAIKSAWWGPMGRVHQGYWRAMGEPTTKHHIDKTTKEGINIINTEAETASSLGPVLRIELTNTSLYQTIVSALQGSIKLFEFVTKSLFHHVKEPIDSSWVGPRIDIRTTSMYALAEEHILQLIRKDNKPSMQDSKMKKLEKQDGADDNGGNSSTDESDDDMLNAPGFQSKRGPDGKNQPKKKRLFIAGHSLGGALGTIFLAKMLQSKSSLLDHFAGLYTFGQPKIGDAQFSKVFSPRMASKIFHHVYNNDIIPRLTVPVLSKYHYSTPPGSLVFIDTAFNIAIYPPNPYTNEPVPVRPISFLHLSGLLNRHVIRRLRKENQIRIWFRILFPFFLNDHFINDYSTALRQGKVHWVIMGAGDLEGGKEQADYSYYGEEEENDALREKDRELLMAQQQKGRRMSIVDVQD
ncbi:class 3-domain-containing protein [Mycotypha africana]|uniref:class 3-domain-containing protein n=1 Tax=Mycotypha africana TaxID=64632 RepID=UPI0023009F46|nr:class 3-domain-containing protein [Mycotypha africana]KAI8968900.1 class 3-domain-containing protein [Mycotypha africana]